jgi:arylsulfatase A-like enzyme
MPATRPNVLVFFTDQQRWDSTGLGGNPMEADAGGLTPHFDRLARAGTYLPLSFTCQPVCGPARSAFQTGRYPTATGCHINGRPPAPHTPMLGTYFRAAGYATGYIGKWHLSDQDAAVPADRRGGYDYWLASNILEFTSDAYHTTLFDSANRPVHLPGYRVDALTDAAIRHLTAPRPAGQPFFLFLSYLEPHHQNHLDDFPPPDGYRARYTRNYYLPPDLAALTGSSHQHLPGYYGMIKRLDEALGRITDALQSTGQLDNTILLFTSDHGCHFKTRNDEYKRSCHDSSLRVPTFLHGPGFTTGGRRPELVSLIDLPPTLLDAAGIAIPADMQGRSLMPVLRHSSAPWPQEVFAQISESQTGRCLRTHRWKYSVRATEIPPWSDVPGSDRYREDCLYNLAADPYELCNLAGVESHRALADSLRSRLVARMVAAGEQPPAIDPAAPRPAGQRRVDPEEFTP